MIKTAGAGLPVPRDKMTRDVTVIPLIRYISINCHSSSPAGIQITMSADLEKAFFDGLAYADTDLSIFALSAEPIA